MPRARAINSAPRISGLHHENRQVFILPRFHYSATHPNCTQRLWRDPRPRVGRGVGELRWPNQPQNSTHNSLRVVQPDCIARAVSTWGRGGEAGQVGGEEEVQVEWETLSRSPLYLPPPLTRTHTHHRGARTQAHTHTMSSSEYAEQGPGPGGLQSGARHFGHLLGRSEGSCGEAGWAARHPAPQSRSRAAALSPAWRPGWRSSRPPSGSFLGRTPSEERFWAALPSPHVPFWKHPRG